MMIDDQEILEKFSGMARLFPLPNIVLFPEAVQGLHIFEPRYRQMTADAIHDDHLIALVLLHPGWENEYDDVPEIEKVACLGRITQAEKLLDGRYNLRLRGLSRIRIVEEVRTDKLYRMARVELMPDIVPDDITKLMELRRRLGEAILPRFDPQGPAYHHLEELFHGDTPLGHLCDLLAFSLPLPLPFKQSLLEQPHVDLRAELMIQALSVPEPIRVRKFPPDFSRN